MLTIRYAAAFPTTRIDSVDPGFTSTDFNEHRGTQTVEEGRRGDRPLRADPTRRANRWLLRSERHRSLVNRRDRIFGSSGTSMSRARGSAWPLLGPGGSARTLGTYSTSCSRPSKVWLFTMSRETPDAVVDPVPLAHRRTFSRWLPHDSEPQIGQLVGLVERDALQVDPRVARAAVQPDAVAEEYRRQVDDDLIE
jgi:hypothetical protein